ncbi:hypothetical protein [Halostagnicola sp. A-GB9-2]|uniref:hypothetical protein n=1 Tax=Halostagnicola sp. A-GB9-2 TaxID=3048066 RepID=UPI0024C07144|nr:hypothetical protein [Halostagnicola sp. A-GB9-2]MDJ1432206.1 hypothetical protein [Halostagnicola sp. A-GB9-2]
MRDYLSTAAVLSGSLLLFVPLTFLTVLAAADTLRIVAGLGPIQNGFVHATVLFSSLVLGYVTAMEICRVRLHGFSELHRGTRSRQLARHGVLGVVALAAAVVLVRILVAAISFGFANNDPAVLGLGVAGALALSWTALGSVNAFRRGTRHIQNEGSR